MQSALATVMTLVMKSALSLRIFFLSHNHEMKLTDVPRVQSCIYT